jgi:hypothetical protein
VRRLALAATGPGPGGIPGSPRVLLTLATPRRYDQPDYYRRVAGRIYGGEARRDPDALLHGSVARFIERPSMWGYLGQLFAISGWTSLPWLGSLRQPTLVLVGDDDRSSRWSMDGPSPAASPTRGCTSSGVAATCSCWSSRRGSPRWWPASSSSPRVAGASDRNRREGRTGAYRDLIFVVLHGPELGKGGHVHYVELDQFIGPRYLVTVHGPVNPAVPPEAALRETRAVLGRIEAGRLRPRSPFELSYAIVSALAQGQEAFVESMVKHRGSAALLWNMARGSDD